MKFSFYIIIPLFLFIYSCTNKDEEKRIFPRVCTTEVTNITENGAVFNGLIEELPSGNEIIDHGFYYGLPSNDAPADYSKVSLGVLGVNENSFKAEVSRDLIKDKTYSVLAFVQTKTHTIYGLATSFVSKGGLGPEIKSFEPKIAGWGDTIKIHGNNFSDCVKNNQVKFDNQNAGIIFANDSLLRAIVPESLTVQKSNISVTSAEKTFQSKDQFQIAPPVIRSSSVKVAYGGTMNLRTKNIRQNLASFYIDDFLLKPTQVSVNEYSVVIPKTFNYGLHKLRIGVWDANAEIKFHYDAPFISDVYPKLVGWNDRLNIVGKNFKSILSNSRIDFKEASCGIYTYSVINDSLIQLKIPQGVTVSQCKVGIVNGILDIYSSEPIRIKPPEIYNLTQNQFCIGDEFSVEGKKIRSDLARCCIDGNCLDVAPSFVDSTHFKFSVPTTLDAGSHKLLLKVGQLESNSIDFVVKKLAVKSIVEPISCRSGRFTILGENFAKYYYQNIVKVNGYQANVIAKDENSITVCLPYSVSLGTNPEIVVSAGMQKVTIPDQITIVEPWEKVAEFAIRYSMGAKFTIGNKFYFSTGSIGGGEFYCYNPDDNSCKRIADYPGGQVMAPACFVIGQKAYVGLGQKASPQNFWSYDSALDKWDEIANCPLKVYSEDWTLNRNRSYTFVDGGNGYVGSIDGGLCKYSPTNNQWSSCKFHVSDYSGYYNMGFSRHNFCYDLSGNNMSVNEYNPKTDSWKSHDFSNYFFTKDAYGSTYVEKLDRMLFDGYVMYRSEYSGIQYLDLSTMKMGFFFPSVYSGALLFSTADGRLFSMFFDLNLNKLMIYQFNFEKYEQIKSLIDGNN